MRHPALPGLRRVSGILILAFLVLITGCEDESGEAPEEACMPGSADCSCLEDGGCEDGLVCADGVCVPEEGERVGLTIGSEDARACEFLLIQTDAASVLSASFGPQTSGALRRRDPNVAIAVSRNDDSAFDNQSLALVIDGDLGELTLESRCFDATGAELEQPDVSLN